MGQYYYAVNIDKKEYLNAHKSDKLNGLKLLEHSYVGNPLLNIITRKLIEDGDWHKNKIVWAGDYGDEGEFIDNISYKDINLYQYANKRFEDVTDSKMNKCLKSIKYFLNHTKNEYFDISKTQEDTLGLKIHPLPILTSNGNGRGGGDYYGTSEELIGSWAGDIISASKKKPSKEFKEITPNFIEKIE